MAPNSSLFLSAFAVRHSPSQVSLFPAHLIFILMRPRRSVCSQPQRFGTDSLHFLCTFISQAAEGREIRRGLSELCKGLTLNVHRLTVAFETLVDEPVEQRAAVVAEGGARVRVDSELVFHLDVLGEEERKGSVKPSNN